MMTKLKVGKKLLIQFIKREEKFVCKYGIVEELLTVNYRMVNKYGHHLLLQLEAQ